ISNTPKQVLLCEALGLDLPQFAHIPLILSKEGGRMSKRHGATSIFEYKNMGFLPDALVNFLSLMGWAPGEDREILPLGEIIRLFDIKDVKKTGAIFDMDKLTWINGQYMASKTAKELFPIIKGEMEKAGKKISMPEEKLLQIIEIHKMRIKTLAEFIPLTDYFFTDDYVIDKKGAEKHLSSEESRKILSEFARRLEGLTDFSHASTEALCRKMADDKNIKPAAIIHPTRVAISGKTAGAGLFEIMEILGKDMVLERMQRAAA
ncbi:MAG: glutamate--tRNA ligase family protein, partial [Candidatus Omnitrophica bacterium]|nr:glutamate--tRNA ligase family protein [Candidatus Omnitrophota bacterium]